VIGGIACLPICSPERPPIEALSCLSGEAVKTGCSRVEYLNKSRDRRQSKERRPTMLNKKGRVVVAVLISALVVLMFPSEALAPYCNACLWCYTTGRNVECSEPPSCSTCGTPHVMRGDCGCYQDLVTCTVSCGYTRCSDGTIMIEIHQCPVNQCGQCGS
jgi:hypothetical protein